MKAAKLISTVNSDQTINVQIMSFRQGVKQQILNVSFDFIQPTLKSDLKEVKFTQNYLF